MVDEKNANEAAEVKENQSEKNVNKDSTNKDEVENLTKTDAAKEEKKVEKTEEKKDELAAGSVIGDLDFLSDLRNDLPVLKSGDIIRVFYRVVEGGKERTQVYEGTVIAIKNKGIAKTITVRKTSFGIAVERIFPLNSKLVQKIEVKKHSKVRRAKLYYLRELKGKAARLKELR